MKLYTPEQYAAAKKCEKHGCKKVAIIHISFGDPELDTFDACQKHADQIINIGEAEGAILNTIAIEIPKK